MSGDIEYGTNPGGTAPALRIGAPERRAARDALKEHLHDERLDADEYRRRLAACDQATNQAELLRVFADLPAPHPELPSSVPPPTQDDSMPPGVVTGCLALLLGVPVAVVLGVVYGTWWALAVPVAVTVLVAFVEQLRQRVPRRGDDHPRRTG